MEHVSSTECWGATLKKGATCKIRSRSPSKKLCLLSSAFPAGTQAWHPAPRIAPAGNPACSLSPTPEEAAGATNPQINPRGPHRVSGRCFVYLLKERYGVFVRFHSSTFRRRRYVVIHLPKTVPRQHTRFGLNGGGWRCKELCTDLAPACLPPAQRHLFDRGFDQRLRHSDHGQTAGSLMRSFVHHPVHLLLDNTNKKGTVVKRCCTPPPPTFLIGVKSCRVVRRLVRRIAYVPKQAAGERLKKIPKTCPQIFRWRTILTGPCTHAKQGAPVKVENVFAQNRTHLPTNPCRGKRRLIILPTLTPSLSARRVIWSGSSIPLTYFPSRWATPWDRLVDSSANIQPTH